MKITQEYSLEQLTAQSVNVVETLFATINKQLCEIGRSRMAYVNSPIGREKLAAAIPEEFVNAVMALWGNSPTVVDPQGGE